VKRSVALMALLFSSSLLLAAVATSPARAAAISNCASLTKWFASQVPASALLSLGGAKAPAPLHADEDFVITFSEIGMQNYSCSGGAPPFGDGSMGLYEPSSRVAMVSNDGPGSVGGKTLFVVSAPPSGLAQRPVGSVRTKRGLKLGMSLQQVESIEGVGARNAGPHGTTIVRYAWHTENAAYWMNLLVKDGSLVAIYIYSAA
jgi:hypothetical protein